MLVLVLYLMPLKKTRAEERLDFKTLFYQDDDDRMQIIAPSFLYEHEASPTLTIKLEGIYNSISGASPTGAPASRKAIVPIPRPTRLHSNPPVSGGGSPTPGGDDEKDDKDHGDHMLNIAPAGGARTFQFKAGATPVSPPAPTPSPSPAPSSGSQPASGGSSSAPASQPASTSDGKVPMADVEDERVGLTLSLIKRMGTHTPTAQFAFSTERDYTSLGLALTDAVDYNQKNTTLMYGGAYTHDLVNAITMESSETKQTIDLLLGVTQLISPETFFTVNFTLSRADGFMSDPYKVVELNGQIVPENRPDTKDKFIVFAALNHFFRSVEGAAEVSYRWYSDTYEINANTVQLAWFQKLNRQLTLSPSVRFYDQCAASFYSVRFTGDPENYSSDYRISAMQSIGYGLKLIWMVSEKVSVDIAFDRYSLQGTDSVTPEEAYPSANVITSGVRIWF